MYLSIYLGVHNLPEFHNPQPNPTAAAPRPQRPHLQAVKVVKLSDQRIKQVLRGAIYGHRKTDGRTKLYVEVASCHPLICLYVVVLITFT